MTMVNADTKVALVTGGAQRIGARLCRALQTSHCITGVPALPPKP